MKYTERTEQAQTYTSYRWVILILLGLSMITANGSNIQIAALGERIVGTYHLSAASFGAITSVVFLSGVAMGIPSGALADRFGAKKVMGILMIIGTLGSILRIFATTPAVLFISMFLIGLINAGSNANAAKLLVMWFPKKQIPLAMGIFVGTSTLGAIVALITTPAMVASGASIRTIFTCGAVACTIGTALWFIFAKSKPKGARVYQSASVLEHMPLVLKTKSLWIAGCTLFLLMGCAMASSVFLVVCLTSVKHATLTQAAFLSSLAAALCLAGTIIIPPIIGRAGYMKRGYIVVAVIVAATITVGWSLPFGGLSMAILLIGMGSISSGIPMLAQFPSLLKSIPKDALGSAGGMLSTMQSLGAFVVPTFILGPIAKDNYSVMMYGTAVLLIVSAILCLFLPEVGSKGKAEPTQHIR
ncbi:MAG: MFS transporter [Clostridiales Family XIII bacterium]|jgi:NNP family nitrate/nitrite transporter-like MFS transporter|nr:MFS transporter [Clostridiales Family XIII bacterium]